MEEEDLQSIDAEIKMEVEPIPVIGNMQRACPNVEMIPTDAGSYVYSEIIDSDYVRNIVNDCLKQNEIMYPLLQEKIPEHLCFDNSFSIKQGSRFAFRLSLCHDDS